MGRWSETETRALISGVEKFGIGRWQHIIEFYQEFSLGRRTSSDLSNKYRNLKKTEKKRWQSDGAVRPRFGDYDFVRVHFETHR